MNKPKADSEYEQISRKAEIRLGKVPGLHGPWRDRDEFEGELNRILTEEGANTVPTWPNHIPHARDCECGYCVPVRLEEAKLRVETLKDRNRALSETLNYLFRHAEERLSDFELKMAEDALALHKEPLPVAQKRRTSLKPLR